jgi:pimeloyl-ACP methyl ester carboxylesterase
MSVLIVDGRPVHYECVGNGRPVFFLHGWSGSWRYWLPTMVAMGHLSRCYSFDFFGFGDSRADASHVAVTSYAEQVLGVMDHLGIAEATLVGHSMGGMVALTTALAAPERITRVVTVGAPLHGGALSGLLQLLRHNALATAFGHLPWLRRRIFRFFLGADVGIATAEVVRDSSKSAPPAIHAAVCSMMETDLRPHLAELPVSTLLIHGERDDVVAPPTAGLPVSDTTRVILLPDSRHFPFLDRPLHFNRLLARELQFAPDAPTQFAASAYALAA